MVSATLSVAAYVVALLFAGYLSYDIRLIPSPLMGDLLSEHRSILRQLCEDVIAPRRYSDVAAWL